MTSALASKPEMLDIEVDSSLLDVLYRGRLMELRDRAEAEGFSKTGSVEVLRARLIQHLVLGEMDHLGRVSNLSLTKNQGLF